MMAIRLNAIRTTACGLVCPTHVSVQMFKRCPSRDNQCTIVALQRKQIAFVARNQQIGFPDSSQGKQVVVIGVW